MTNDILGRAIFAYKNDPRCPPIAVFVDGRRDADLLPESFFRSFRQMPLIERRALKLCHGKILDIGSGAGAHALYLQNKNLDVTAVEISRLACKVLKKRGVLKVLCRDIFKIKKLRFDSIILLMNGLGIQGNVQGTLQLLRHLRNLLAPDGQILADSADIDHLFYPRGRRSPRSADFREVVFKLKFRSQASSPFQWIYFRYSFFKKLSKRAGLQCELVQSTKRSGYLVRLTRE